MLKITHKYFKSNGKGYSMKERSVAGMIKKRKVEEIRSYT